MRLLVFIKKELLLLSRDLHGLALLFVMPVLFILIMSLAMQNTFSEHSAVKIDYVLVDADGGESAQWVAQQLEAGGSFRRSHQDTAVDELAALVKSDQAQFLVTIPAGFSESLDTMPAEVDSITVQIAPATQAATALLFESKLRDLVARRYIESVTRAMGGGSDDIDVDALQSAVTMQSSDESSELLPTSVQQNVPAWLVFSMFFIAIPVSTTLLGERAQGTLDRLGTMSVSRTEFLLAKLFTYMLVNLLQVVLMFAVGVWVVPMFGGDALTLGQSPVALVVMALAISFAAVSLALVIANLAKTTEQATVVAGASNIILAAVGGVMVPRFVMPPAMQSFSMLSPHAWGLEGFLDIILRTGGISEILPETGLLFLFGMIMLMLSVFLLKRR